MILSNNNINVSDIKNENKKQGKDAYLSQSPNMYVLTVEWGEGKSVQLEVFQHSKPEEIAFNFCKKYNLDFKSMEMITQQIKELGMKQNRNIISNNKSLINSKNNSTKHQTNKVKEYMNKPKAYFNPYEIMFKKGNETQRLAQNKLIYTPVSSIKTKTMKKKNNKGSPFTIEQNENKLKAFLTVNENFTELLYHRSKIPNNEIYNSNKPLTSYTQRSVSKNTNTNHNMTPRVKTGYSFTCGKRSYSSLNTRDKETYSTFNQNAFYLNLYSHLHRSNPFIDKINQRHSNIN